MFIGQETEYQCMHELRFQVICINTFNDTLVMFDCLLI